MDDYEFSEAKGPPQRKRPAGLIWNILTIVILIAIVCIISAFFMIYVNPNSFLNPFPPPTLNPIYATATATTAPRFTLVPSWTPTNVVLPATETPAPTHTPLVTTSMVDNPTMIPLAAANNQYAFAVQQGSPAAIDAVQFHPDTDCRWSGVAGQAISLNGEAVKGLFVQLGGSLPGVESVDNLTMTG